MAKVDPSERLFNLTCALIWSRRGLTKQEIFNKVRGYLPDGKTTYNLTDKELDAINRLFDRDKTELLISGIQLDGRVPIEALDDSTEYRYTIPRESVAWPSDLKLDSRQVALLNLAAEVWAQASISTEASRAVMRLRALGETPEDSGLVGVAPSIRTHESSFTPLSMAIANRTVVEFDYRKAGSNQSERRVVQPWALQNISGQWLLVCWDIKRNAVRNFLLKRIVSPVKAQDRTFAEPTEQQVADALAELNDLISDQIALIRIKPDSAAWLHFELPVDSNGEHEIHYMDIHLLAEELREFIHDLESVRPDELKNAIDAGLQQVVSDHHA